MTSYLSADDLVAIARRLFGDPPPVRDLGLLESAAARPQASFGGEDAYPDIWTKAAALLHSVVANHALVDGNKRLGWLSTVTFLAINEIDATGISFDDAYDLVIDIAAGELREVEEIAARLRRLIEP